MKVIANNSNTKIVKQNLSWHIALAYLENLENYNSLFGDKEFSRMFKALEKYVNDKISVPNDIVATYVIVEHTIDDSI